MGAWFIKAVAFLLALAGLFAFFGVTCGQAECFDCLTRGANWQNPDKAKGDIIACRPAGWQWGKKEKAGYKVVTICDMTKEQAAALSAFEVDAEGNQTNRLRFKALVVDGKDVIADKVTSQVVTPADAEKESKR